MYKVYIFISGDSYFIVCAKGITEAKQKVKFCDDWQDYMEEDLDNAGNWEIHIVEDFKWSFYGYTGDIY